MYILFLLAELIQANFKLLLEPQVVWHYDM